MAKPKIEDLRGYRPGDVRLWFGPEAHAGISAAFHHHATQANWHTINCLLRFADIQVDGVPNVHRIRLNSTLL